ncbi:MAG: Methyltransferase type 11 [Myxococcales bacterium]|nr:Methyltransferase type 11 [Myxococcales bacterium]
MTMLTAEAVRYEEPPAPAWDVGRPQRAIYDLELAGEIGRAVLDVGCGIGEHALFFAERGHTACGVDPSARSIAKAQKRARQRNLPICFVVEELLQLGRLGMPFDAAVDAGSFHRIDIAARADYAASLRTVVKPGGRLFVLCFGDHERGRGGPRRVSQDELRATFDRGWRIDGIDSSSIESHIYPGGANAWLLRATRTS